MANLATSLSRMVDLRFVDEDLVTSNLGLIKSLVSKFIKDKSKIEDSDLYSVACIAIVEASKTFDPSKAKFSTWATRHMKQAVLDQIRKNKRNNSYLVMLGDLEQKEQEEVLSEELRKVPYHLLELARPTDTDAKNTKESKKMLLMYYLEEKSLSEIGEFFGYTKEGVRKKISKVLSEIKEKNKNILDNLI